jgi:hypothetical protein
MSSRLRGEGATPSVYSHFSSCSCLRVSGCSRTSGHTSGSDEPPFTPWGSAKYSMGLGGRIGPSSWCISTMPRAAAAARSGALTVQVTTASGRVRSSNASMKGRQVGRSGSVISRTHSASSWAGSSGSTGDTPKSAGESNQGASSARAAFIASETANRGVAPSWESP